MWGLYDVVTIELYTIVFIFSVFLDKLLIINYW